MTEIRKIFEAVRTYCGMMFGDERAAKQLGSKATKQVTGKMYCHALLSEGESGLFAEGEGSTRRRGADGAFRRPVKREQPSKVAVRAERVTDTREGLSQILSLQNTPLSRISNAHWCSQRTATSSLGEVSSTPQQQPLSIVIPSVIRRVRSGCRKLGGLQDFSATTETRLTRMRILSGIQSINNRHSEGNNNLSPKNLVTSNQLDLSLNAQDDDNISRETVHSPLTTHHSLKRAAFTLAEVLITLGIIGVVAALTLPTLIQNHQKQVYVTQLKKAYSTLGNALNKMAADEGVGGWGETYCATTSFWVNGDYEATKGSYRRQNELLI